MAAFHHAGLHLGRISESKRKCCVTCYSLNSCKQ
jgi:hypothetical protein